MTKKDRQREAILRHGFKLIRVFNLPQGTAPVTLCKKVHRLEVEAQRLAERQCTEEVSEAYVEKKEASILKRLDVILNFEAQKIPVFLNHDPRGYALKIHSDYVKGRDIDIHRDWGGYGVIAPEF